MGDVGFTPIWCVDADGGLDLDKLMEVPQDFFRRHSGHWKKRFLWSCPVLVDT